MNTYLLIAEILCLLAFLAHTFGGDRELQVLHPRQYGGSVDQQEKWTMARAGWHWVSIDLLFATILLAIINHTDHLIAEEQLLKLMSCYFLAYGFVWLLVIAISKSFPNNYLKLGQWLLLFIIAGLIYAGSN